MPRLLGDDALGDTGSSSRGRKTGPQRVTGHLAGVGPGTDGVALQHECHRVFEIAEAAEYSKAHASDIRRKTWTPHVSTWLALARLVNIAIAARPFASSRAT